MVHKSSAVSIASSAADRPSARHRFRPFSSIGAKLVLILLAMGAASAGIGVLVSLVFARVSDDMGVLTQDMLPQLEVSARLTEATGLTRNAMTDILLADNTRIKIDLAASRDTLSNVKFSVVLAFCGPLP